MLELDPSRYETRIEQGDARSLVIELTGGGHRVLEVGTSTGYMSRIFKEMGNSVTGVEKDEKAAESARQYCDSLIIGDIEEPGMEARLGSYDAIVLADLLEHLADPWKLLTMLKRHLSDGGYLVVSIPNACHGDVLLSMLREDFRYMPTGLLDVTHLRFFAYRNVIGLLRDCGYAIKDLRTVRAPVGQTELSAPAHRTLFRFIESLPYADVYQFVFRAYSGDKTEGMAVPQIPLDDIFNVALNEAIDERLKDLLKDQMQVISGLHEKCLHYEREILAIQGTAGWKFLSRYSELLGRFLPPDTRRRSAYALLVKSLAILASEGPYGLLRRYRERKLAMATIEARVGAPPIERAELKEWRGEELAFPEPPQAPAVSIVIPVHNQVTHTYNCLRSILENTAGTYEVIVVDDASTDDTARLLEKARNLRVLRNEANVGFIESCNRGAGASRGESILFLNNDTIVTRGWLEPLAEALEREGVGAVGSKLLYPDGRLQEAGGIIWADASGHNYGRGDDPRKPEYNFVREADYCSGAALLVKADLFRRCGGFDELFRPGYYEDADLCFRLRELGYRVLYQPGSAVFHFEGATGGTSTDSGAKRYQPINREKFLEKWGDALKKHPAPSISPWQASDRRRGKRILVIDQYVPHYDRDAGSVRMYNLMRIFSELGHRVTFIGDNASRFEPYASALQRAGVEVIYDPYAGSIKDYLIRHGRRFDLVILSRSHIAIKHVADAKKYCPGARLVFDTVDLQFVREARRAEVEGDRGMMSDADGSKRRELWLAKMCDVTLVVSDVEKDILKQEDPSLRVEVVSLIHEFTGTVKPFSGRKGLMFLGNFLHLPNADAALWFAREVFPLILGKIPDMELYLVGDMPPREIADLASKNIIVTGHVLDLGPYFEKCRVFVAPLRYGAGVKGKICDSMGCGLPVVTTPIGAEGMGLVHGENALVADGAEAFAENVVRLYEDEALWSRLSKQGSEHAREQYSYGAWKEKLSRLLDGRSAACPK